MVHKNEFNFVLWLSSNLSTRSFDSRDLSTYGFHRFLWNMANFWIFSNHNYQQVDEVEKRVEEKAHWSKGILSDINKNLKKRDDLRVQLEKMKIYNEQKQKDIEGEWLHFNISGTMFIFILTSFQLRKRSWTRPRVITHWSQKQPKTSKKGA